MEALIASKEQGSRVYSFRNEGGYLIGSCTLERLIDTQRNIYYRISDIDICTPVSNEEKLQAIINAIVKIIALDTHGQSFFLQINNDSPTVVHPPQRSMPFSKQYMQGES